MTDKELMQQALDALSVLTKEMLACRNELAERGARPETPHKQKLWDSAFNAYTGMASQTYEAIRARLAQPEVTHWSDCAVHSEPAYPAGECDCGGVSPEQEPVAWMHIHGSHEDPCFYELTEDEISEGWTQKPLYYTAPPQRECEICGKVAKP